jgi:hypothetical protein
MEWAYNALFEGKKAVFLKSLWQDRSEIIFQATSDISPRKKNVLIDYERLQELLGAGSYIQCVVVKD